VPDWESLQNAEFVGVCKNRLRGAGMVLHKVHTNCALLASSPVTRQLKIYSRERSPGPRGCLPQKWSPHRKCRTEILADLLRALGLVTELDRVGVEMPFVCARTNHCHCYLFLYFACFPSAP
jgi:hypothetical protein